MTDITYYFSPKNTSLAVLSCLGAESKLKGMAWNAKSGPGDEYQSPGTIKISAKLDNEDSGHEPSFFNCRKFLSCCI